MKRVLATLFLGMSMAFNVAFAPGAEASLKDFLFGDKTEAKQPKTLEELRSLQPIPFASQDDDQIPGQLHARRVFGQYYAAVDVQVGGSNFFPDDCDKNASWKFLRFLGVNRDGTFSAVAKFTVGNASTEFVPLFVVAKSGNKCEVKVSAEFAGKGVQVTPYFRLDPSKEIQVQFQVHYSDKLTFDVAERWFDVFYTAATGFFNIGNIGIDRKGITLKKSAVLSDEEFKQIQNSVSGVDATLTKIFGDVVDSDRKLTMSFTMPVEEARGAWLRTGLGPAVNSVVGLKAANIALVIRPRISLLVNNDLVNSVPIRGADHLVPDFSTVGNGPRTSEIFYAAATQSLESFNSLATKDEALKEKLEDLPTGADLNAWHTACGKISNYLQERYGLNDYDTLAIVASLFRSNADLDRAFSFAEVGCTAGLPIGDYWPHTKSPEMNAEPVVNCWNDMGKRTEIRDWLDNTVLLGLRRTFINDQAEKRAELLTKNLTPTASLDDPHGVLTAQTGTANTADRLKSMPLGDGAFCFDSPQGLDAPVYQRGFLAHTATGIAEVLFGFEDLCNKAANQQTPQINRVTLLGLSDDDDDLTINTVERVLNANKSCNSCIKRLRSSLPNTFGRFQSVPACP